MFNKIMRLFSRVNKSALAYSLFMTMPFTLVISSILFAFGLSLNPLIYPIAVAFGALSVLFNSTLNIQDKKITLVSYFCIWLTFLLMATLPIDWSWDGNTYRKSTILALSNGWSPFFDHHSLYEYHDRWVDHYARGLEILSSTVFCSTGFIESGKVYNLIIVFCCLLFTNDSLCHINFCLSKRKRLFYTITMVMSPVVVGQIFTYQTDFSMYCLLLIMVHEFLIIRDKIEWRQILVLSSCIILLVSIKFNFAFWGGFLLLCVLILYVTRKKYHVAKQLFFIGCVSLVLGVLINYNPYFTNFIDHGTPFYPIFGSEECIPVDQNQMPQNYLSHSNFVNVLISLFSHPQNNAYEATRLMFPFIFSPSDLLMLVDGNARAGGFGVWFSGFIILSILLYLFTDMRKTDRIQSAVVLFLLFTSLFILPVGWNARYVAFFYAFPFIAMLYCEKKSSKPYLRKLLYFVAVTNLVLTVLVVFAFACVYNVRNYKAIDIVKSKESPHLYFDGGTGFKHQINERGISYIEIKDTTNNQNFEKAIDLKIHPKVFLFE